jgi:hypothetical protein
MTTTTTTTTAIAAISSKSKTNAASTNAASLVWIGNFSEWQVLGKVDWTNCELKTELKEFSQDPVSRAFNGVLASDIGSHLMSQSKLSELELELDDCDMIHLATKTVHRDGGTVEFVIVDIFFIGHIVMYAVAVSQKIPDKSDASGFGIHIIGADLLIGATSFEEFISFKFPETETFEMGKRQLMNKITSELLLRLETHIVMNTIYGSADFVTKLETALRENTLSFAGF